MVWRIVFMLVAAGAFAVPVFSIAQEDSGRDCWQEFSAALGECSSAWTSCTQDCLNKNFTDPAGRQECNVPCNSANEACRQSADSAYDSCVAVPQAQTEQGDLTAAESAPEDKVPQQLINENALVERIPAKEDLQPAVLNEPHLYDEQGRLQAIVTELEGGTADIQLADGTWLEAKEGSVIPYGATIFTGYRATATLQFANHIVVAVGSLGELNVEQFVTDPLQYIKEVKLGTGEARFRVMDTGFKSSTRVSTPNASASIQGTDFGVAYNKETQVSVWEIYDGTIEVESTATGEKQRISSAYGAPITRVTVAKDGALTDTIVLPGSVAVQLEGEKEGQAPSFSWWIALFLVAGIGALAAGFLFFKRR